MLNLKHLVIFTLTTLALSACASQAAPGATGVSPTEEAQAEIAVPTLTPLLKLTPVVDNCLDCHTDKDRLVALAKEEEAGHGSESEGVG